MSTKTESPASVSRNVPVYCLFGACVGVAILALYGLLLIPATPAEAEDESTPLDVEETVLFYQPEEYADLAPLAEAPAELEYIYQARYMA